MEIIVYALINALLIVFIVLAVKWSLIGAFGGLLGGIFSYLTVTDETLILQSVWNETGQTWVQQSMSMGFFAYVPVVLMAACFILALKK